jgi:hypothetical protein
MPGRAVPTQWHYKVGFDHKGELAAYTAGQEGAGRDAEYRADCATANGKATCSPPTRSPMTRPTYV